MGSGGYVLIGLFGDCVDISLSRGRKGKKGRNWWKGRKGKKGRKGRNGRIDVEKPA